VGELALGVQDHHLHAQPRARDAVVLGPLRGKAAQVVGLVARPQVGVHPRRDEVGGGVHAQVRRGAAVGVAPQRLANAVFELLPERGAQELAECVDHRGPDFRLIRRGARCRNIRTGAVARQARAGGVR
jgi:hypothetical protein